MARSLGARRRSADRRRLRRVAAVMAALAAGIEPLLLRFSGRRSVVRGTPLAGTLLAMVLVGSRTDNASPADRVPRMREKANPAVRAVSNAAQKLGMGLQDRVQRGLILPDKRLGAVVLVPICAKREKLLDGYGKKARLSVIILIVVVHTLVLPPRCECFERKGEVFCAHGQRTARRPSAPTIRYASFAQTILLAESDTASLGVKVRS